GARRGRGSRQGRLALGLHHAIAVFGEEHAALEDALGVAEGFLGDLDAETPSEHELGLASCLGAGLEDAFEDPAQAIPALYLEARPSMRRQIDALHRIHDVTSQRRRPRIRTPAHA